jgi:uncharacterized protein YlzI (FlbEa/FlbD family)
MRSTFIELDGDLINADAIIAIGAGVLETTIHLSNGHTRSVGEPVDVVMTKITEATNVE